MTPIDGKRPPARLARRRFLGALAVAPAALACATAKPAAGAPQRPAASRPPAAPAGGPPPPHGEGALAAVRKIALARDAEPATVFRAAPARPGGAR